VIYVRWRKGESRRGRVFPEAGEIGGLPCPWCSRALHLRLPIQLIAVGPEVDNPEAMSKYAEGRWFTCAATAMHASCAEYLDDDRLEILVSELEVVGRDG
jgi:hypothetical protein